MSLTITPYPTASAMKKALDGQPAGIALQGKYIGVGKGLQEIEFDDGGRAITDRLSQPVEWLEILAAQRVNDFQWQLVIDFAGTNNGVEYNLAEIALSGAATVAEANNEVIAIYSNQSQAIMTVSPQVDHALVAINLVLATMPAGSVEIVHHNLPLDLSIAAELAQTMVSVGEMSLAMMSMVDNTIQIKNDYATQQQQISDQQQAITALNDWRPLVVQFMQDQEFFNASTFNGFGNVSLALTQ